MHFCNEAKRISHLGQTGISLLSLVLTSKLSVPWYDSVATETSSVSTVTIPSTPESISPQSPASPSVADTVERWPETTARTRDEV